MAGDLMTRDPQTLPETMPIDEATRFFATDAHHRSYPVVDGELRPVGLVSRRDALRWQQGGEAGAATIGDQLTDISMPVVTPDTPADAVANLMITEQTGRICVVAPDSGRLVGIIARRDLLRSRAAMLRGELERSR
jgi:CBS domain-containing protein